MFFAQSSHHESSNNASRRSQGFHQSSPTGAPPPPPPPQQQQQQSRNHAEHRCRPHVVVALAAGLSASLSTSRSLSSSSASCAVATDSAVHSITRCLPVAAAAAAAVPAMPFTTSLLDADADEGNRQATSISVSLPRVDHRAVPAAPVVPPFAYRDLPRQAQATAPVARPATSRNTAASSSLSGVLVAATRDVSNRETTLAGSTSPRRHPPLTHDNDNDNDDEDDDDDEKQRRSSTDGVTVRTPAVVTATPTTEFPASAISPEPQPSFSSSPSNPADDKVGSFVREVMNEVDVPPGLLRFLQERKQQESPSTTSSSPATTTMPAIPVVVSTAPMHSHPLIFAHRPSTKEAPAGPRGAVAGGPALTSPVAGQQQQQQQPKQQQQEQQLQLQLFSLADATSTAVRRSNETSTTNACTDTPAAVTAAQSEVRGPLELVMLDQPVSRPSLDLNSASGVTVGTIAGEGVESSKTTSRTQWTRMLRKGRANSGQTSSHGEETATTTMHSLCTASRTAHPARLSAAQPGDNVQASSGEGSSHHPSTPSRSPNPFYAVARCRGSGADLERKEVSPCLQHLRQGLLQPASGGAAQGSITSFPSPVGRAMTPLAAAAPTTNFAVSLASSPPFSMPLPTTTAVGSAHKRRSLLVVRNMEDAPFLIQQHHQQMEQQQEEEQRQQQQQQHSPQHSWQLAHRRSPPTFTSSCTAGASLLSDSPVGMNFVDGSATTSPTPAGDLEPPLTAGVAWMDSFSPYASIVSPTATQTTMATNYGSTVFTGSLTQSIGVLSAAALTLAERSATRPVQPGFGSPSQSATSRQRRPQATAVTPLTTGLMILSSNVGHIGPSSAALHSPASSDKYSGRQNSHERRSLLYQQQQQQQHQHPS